MLEVENLKCAYGRIEVLHGVSVMVGAGEIVALVGANGAGKTTLLRAISGVQPVTGGRIRFRGKAMDKLASHARVTLGIVQVPEGRQLFAPLSVEDNLKLGAWSRRTTDLAAELAGAYALFPVLAEMRGRPAGALSGGQQQMLALARALMAKPVLLLLDEPSMGLSPLLIEQIFRRIGDLKREGLTMLLVEQNAQAALAVADRAYVLESGHVTLSGTSAEIQDDRRVREAYLGV